MPVRPVSWRMLSAEEAAPSSVVLSLASRSVFVMQVLPVLAADVLCTTAFRRARMQPGRLSCGCPEDGTLRHDHADECVSRRHARTT